ncbi:MAG: hypothetical protein IPN63_10950 [Gammaproteobacteria bacterium]|nr:hypothetical protein [Gammaproteobacteria bacterium]
MKTIGYPPILDNIEPRILPAGKQPDLTPAYSFNGSDLWLARCAYPPYASIAAS